MRLKQRQANREVLGMAVAMVRDSDFEQLFGDLGDIGETPAEEEHNYETMEKAQRYAVRRIERLIAP